MIAKRSNEAANDGTVIVLTDNGTQLDSGSFGQRPERDLMLDTLLVLTADEAHAQTLFDEVEESFLVSCFVAHPKREASLRTYVRDE